MSDRLTPERALARLGQEIDGESVELFEHGSLQIELYKPKGVDLQEPHWKDEVYVVISGSGYFVNGGQRQPFESGEVLFVPAGVEHRFEDFTEDFATWVLFYGPAGGEGEDR